MKENRFFRLNHALGGFNPFGYHLLNTVLHALVTVMVYEFYQIILKRCAVESQRRSLSFFAALLFALHPIHTEAVHLRSEK